MPYTQLHIEIELPFSASWNSKSQHNYPMKTWNGNGIYDSIRVNIIHQWFRFRTIHYTKIFSPFQISQDHLSGFPVCFTEAIVELLNIIDCIEYICSSAYSKIGKTVAKSSLYGKFIRLSTFLFSLKFRSYGELAGLQLSWVWVYFYWQAYRSNRLFFVVKNVSINCIKIENELDMSSNQSSILLGVSDKIIMKEQKI